MCSRRIQVSVFPIVLLLGLCGPAGAATLDFEDLGQNLPIGPNDFYDGRSAYDPNDEDATDFSSQGATFNNDFDDFGGGCCWQGWSYSQTDDTGTSGPGNQYSAIPGAGVGGSATYGVGFAGGVVGTTGLVTITLDQASTVSGAWITNTTWGALAMLQGDDFAKQFGGASGTDPDFFALTISGYDTSGSLTGAIEFLLADYRFEDDSEDYVVVDWTFVDLSGLGVVETLDFTLESSDTDFGFINTPSYFALDDLVIVPEPASGSLLLLGLGALGLRGHSTATRRRRR
jgi:hypothetical protein